jgi:hypothetical protein
MRGLTPVGVLQRVANPRFFAPPVIEAIQDTTTGSGSTAVATIVALAPAGIVAGELLILALHYASSSTLTACVYPESGGPAGWKPIGHSSYNANGAPWYFWYKIATGSEGNISLTRSSGVAYITTRYIRISGADPINPIGSRTWNGGAYGTYTTKGAQTLTDNCLALAFAGAKGGNYTLPIMNNDGGWDQTSQLDAYTYGGAHQKLAYTVIAAKGNIPDLTWTFSASPMNAWHTWMITVNPVDYDDFAYSGPIVSSWQTSLQTSTGPSLNMVAPSGISTGNLLILAMSAYCPVTLTYFNTPAGWTKAGEYGNSNPDSYAAIFYKVSDGTEGNVTITNNNSSYWMCGTYFNITGAAAVSPLLTTQGTASASNITDIVLNTITPTTIADCMLINVGAMNIVTSGPINQIGKTTREYVSVATVGPTTGVNHCVSIGKLPYIGDSTEIRHMSRGASASSMSNIACVFKPG